MNDRNWWRLASGLAVLLLVLAMAGFVLAMNGCYHPPRVHDRGWTPPITITADQDYLDTYGRSLDAAVRFWNREVGCKLFRRGEPADLTVQIGPYVEGVAGTAIHRGALYRAPQDLRHAFIVAAHEMGHHLGLDHDRFPCSVMFPSVTGDFDRLVDEDAPQCEVVLVPSETARDLRRVYCDPSGTRTRTIGVKDRSPDR